MNEKKIQSLLIQIFGAALKGAAAEEELLTPENLPAVYALAKKHSLGHFVTRYVFENGIATDPEMARKLQREELVSVHQYERMQYTYREICQIFDEANIAYIPLKGAVMRPFYPEESMRTSCDIDILIQEAELDAAIDVLENKGYRCGERHYHDVSLYSPNKIHLELHFNILENMDLLDSVLKDAWQYAVPIAGNRREFRKEFFVFHMYAHMAYHFMAGGCGIRALIDIWVMEHRMNAPYTAAEKLLKKAGIYRFASEMSKLANRCITDLDSSDPLLEYIWRGGVYGTTKNKLAIQKLRMGSMAGYAKNRLFPPLKTMEGYYPILKKFRILLPFIWIWRGVKAVFKGRTKVLVSEISYTHGISDDSLSEAEAVCSRLGL